MAKLSQRRFKQKSEEGATLIVRDHLAPLVDDASSEFAGEFPPLLAPDGRPCTLTLLGADSDKARQFDYRRSASAQNRLYAGMLGKAKQSNVMKPEDIAEQVAYELDKLVALTVDWSGWEDEDGSLVPFSPEAARDLYAQDATIREQAIAFIADRARFFARSSTPSAPLSIITSD